MKLLLEHLKNNAEALQSYSEHVGIASHPVNLGSAREGVIANFLERNLPENIKYHTGEIFDRKENRSGQIDVVIHPISSPKINLYNSINIFPAETVLAALEVKSNLTTGKNGTLTKALQACEKLKKVEVLREKSGHTINVDPTAVPFIIFAYKGMLNKTLLKHLEAYEPMSGGLNYRVLPDLIVVLDRGYYLLKTPGWHAAGVPFEQRFKSYTNNENVLLGIFAYLLKLIETWFNNPLGHNMPIKEYTQDMTSILSFLQKTKNNI